MGGVPPSIEDSGFDSGIRPYVIDDGMAGTWRAALHPNNRCAGCGQSICAHPDAVWSGIAPLDNATGGRAECDGFASPVAHPLHTGDNSDV